MNVHNIDKEAEITAEAIAKGEAATHFDKRLTPSASEGDDLLALFLGTPGGGVPGRAESEGLPPPPGSLFESDLRYCEAALHRLRARNGAGAGTGGELRFETSLESGTLTLDAPDDLRHRFSFFPREVVPESGRFVLTSDRRRMNDAIAENRRHETAWPRERYLWRLRPVVRWLNDRILSAFGRHEAPVLAGISGLARNETVFVISGLVPNRRSHPLVHEWVGVAFRGEQFDSLIPFDDLVGRTGLGTGTPIANRGRPVDVGALAPRLPAPSSTPDNSSSNTATGSRRSSTPSWTRRSRCGTSSSRGGSTSSSSGWRSPPNLRRRSRVASSESNVTSRPSSTTTGTGSRTACRRSASRGSRSSTRWWVMPELTLI